MFCRLTEIIIISLLYMKITLPSVSVKPSYIAQVLSGLLLFWAALIASKNYKLATIVLLFSMAISLHGLMHMFAEIVYGFNPLETGIFYY